ncbi:porin family protein [Flavobacterium sp.]
MKKIILSVAAIFAFGVVSAQDIKFGVKGGLNSSNITNTDGSKALVGFHVGGLAEFKVSEKFAVQPELLYSTQGAGSDGGDLKLDYINIPIMAKFYVAEKFSIQAGPQIGFLMTAKADGEDVKDFFKTTDFGVNIGVGYNLDENMMLDLRYNMGLSQVQKEVIDGTSKSMNQVIQLSFGYKF